jgi:hypothetical protein
MHVTTTQLTIWAVALLCTTFAAGCQLGQVFRKSRPVTIKKGKK